MEKPILNLISVFGWNGPYIVSCCNAMFGTGNFVLVQNLVEDIKILKLRPFAAICDHLEDLHSQKWSKREWNGYSSFSCIHLGSWTLIPINFYTPFWLYGAAKGSQIAANGLKFKILMSSTRFWTKTKFPVPNIAPQQLTMIGPIQPKTEINFKMGFSIKPHSFFGLYLPDLRQRK